MGVIGGSFQPTREKTFLSTNDLSAKQGFGVALDASNANSIVLSNAQTLETIGILVYPPKAAGDTCKVALFGPTVRAIASGAITKGAKVTTDASGKMVTTTTPADKVAGIALETTTADGDSIEIMLTGGHYYHA